MKNLLFGIIATVLFSFTGNAQKVSDYFVKSQTRITKNSSDGYYNSYIKNIKIVEGISIIGSDFIVHNLADSNIKLIEVPVIDKFNRANFMFFLINFINKNQSVIYKNHLKDEYTFFNQSLQPIYKIKISNGNLIFENINETGNKSNCYSSCRNGAWSTIESDFLSDFACSFNPCGAAIAAYCLGVCTFN